MKLFRARFAPGAGRSAKPAAARSLAETQRTVAEYNTGHRYLDEVRRDHLPLLPRSSSSHTLKTNFFVLEKQALAFRLDPAYLAELGQEFTADLPPAAAVPGHLLLQPLRLRLPHRLLRHRPRRLAHRHRPRTRRLHHQRQHDLPGELRPGAHPAPEEQGHLRGGLEAGGDPGCRRPAAGRGARSMENLAPLQAPVRRDQRLPRHLRHGGRGREDSARGRLLPRGRADRARARREPARFHDRGDRLALEAARLHAGHRHHLQQAGRHQPQGVRRHLHRRGEIRRDHHGGAGHRHPPGPFQREVHRGPERRRGRQRHADPAGALAPGADPAGPGRHGGAVRPGRGRPPRSCPASSCGSDLDAFSPEALHPGGFMLFRSGTPQGGAARTVPEGDPGRLHACARSGSPSTNFTGSSTSCPSRCRRTCSSRRGGGPRPSTRATGSASASPDGTPSARAIVEGANSFITPEARVQLQKKRGHHHARRLRQQVRGDLLLLRDHRQPAPVRERVPGRQGALRPGCAGDPGEAGGGRGAAHPEAAPRTAGAFATPKFPMP